MRELNPNVQIIIATHSPALSMNGWLDKVFNIEDLIVKEASTSVGVFSNKPQYEYDLGFGLRVGRNLQDLYYMSYSRINQFDTASGLSQGISMVSFN